MDTTTTSAVVAAQSQDALRPLRNFISLVSGATSDQSYADQDGYAINPAGQIAVQGPNGVAIQGQPVLVAAPAQPGAPAATPNHLLLIGVALVAAYFLLRH